MKTYHLPTASKLNWENDFKNRQFLFGIDKRLTPNPLYVWVELPSRPQQK